MADDKMQPIQPLPVTVISAGTGDGSPMVNGQIIPTPDHQPNLVVRVVTPIVAILVRAISVFLNSLLGGLGLVGGGTLTGTLPWATWRVALAFAACAALVNMIQSAATIFGNLEKNHPLLTGSI